MISKSLKCYQFHLARGSFTISHWRDVNNIDTLCLLHQQLLQRSHFWIITWTVLHNKEIRQQRLSTSIQLECLRLASHLVSDNTTLWLILLLCENRTKFKWINCWDNYFHFHHIAHLPSINKMLLKQDFMT